MSNNKERTIEQYLVDLVTRAGGVAFKTISPGMRGFFDRVVVIDGNVAFVETKRPRGGRISPQQRLVAAAFQRAGARVVVVKTEIAAEALVASLKALSAE